METSEKVIAFIETLPSPDNPRDKFHLEEFQKDFLRRVFDPTTVNSKDETVRAVRQAIFTLPRKAGKTSLIAAIVLAYLVGPLAKYNQQIISAAFDREQAAIIYRTIRAIVDADKELSRYLKCVDSGKRVICPNNSSSYHSISSEARSKHGLNPSVIVFDELAQMGTNRELYDVLASSQGAQKEPLFIVISTQAPNNEALLSELIDYGRKVNDGTVEDPSFVLCEYSCPDDNVLAERGLTIWDEPVWFECNPALGKFRSLDEFRNYAAKAKNSPSMEMSFRNLYLNQRISSMAVFVVPSVWNKCGTPFTLDELRGKPAHIGIDLSSRNDLTSIATLVEVSPNRYAIHCQSFIPQDNIEDLARSSRAPYIDWIAAGYIRPTPGASIQYSYVAHYLLDLLDDFDVQRINFDRWRFDILKTELIRANENFPVELLSPFGQGFKDMSPAVEKFEELLLNGHITHGGNPVLRWAFANAVVDKDPAGNRKLTKAKSYGKIDPAVASIMAVGSLGMVQEVTLDIAAMIA